MEEGWVIYDFLPDYFATKLLESHDHNRTCETKGSLLRRWSHFRLHNPTLIPLLLNFLTYFHFRPTLPHNNLHIIQFVASNYAPK